MKRMVSFFEIPATDFQRAVRFYEKVFGLTLEIMECEEEKMAFFPKDEEECPGAISWTANQSFKPSGDGVLISLFCPDIDKTLQIIAENKGKISMPKTKIESEEKGYFALFLDSEGNRLGLYEPAK